MSNSSSERNEAIVLEAFETTFSTAHTSQRVGMVYSG
jgi:hypothetical protein